MNLEDKICLVTGGTSGIGLEVAGMLSEMGHEVIIVGRNEAKCEHVVAQIAEKTGNEKVSYLLCDLSRPDDIKKLVKNFQKKYKKLDILINNAGVYLKSRKYTLHGTDLTFATNCLGPFLLTNLLLDELKAAAPSRIVNVSSRSHFGHKLDLDDPSGEKEKCPPKAAYGKSKLALIMLTYEMARRWRQFGISVNAACPGGVATNIWKNNNDLTTRAFRLAVPLLKTPQQAGEFIVYLATSSEQDGNTGRFFALKKHLRLNSAEPCQAECASSHESYDADMAGELWKICAKMCDL